MADQMITTTYRIDGGKELTATILEPEPRTWQEELQAYCDLIKNLNQNPVTPCDENSTRKAIS